MEGNIATPAISVITPVYNGAATLDRALRSVYGQTFPNWEVVAVDDGSTDGSYDILRRWADMDRRVRPLRQGENSGVSAARNAAIRAARGEFVAYLDQDDEYHPDYLAQVARLHGRADVLVFGYNLVSEDGQAGHRPAACDPAAHRNDFFLHCIVTPLGVAHRRQLWTTAGGFNEMWCFGEDWDFWKRLARAGAEFLFLPIKSGRYHVRSDRASLIPHITRRQSEIFQANWEAGRPLYGGRPLGAAPRKVRKIAFASPHCLVDPSNGAAVATSHLLQLVQDEGFECRALCGPRLDAPQVATLETVLAAAPNGGGMRKTKLTGCDAEMLLTRLGSVPLAVFSAPFNAAGWFDEAATTAFYQSYTAFLDDYRPDVLLTYGGHPVAVSMMELAKKRDIPIVFALHNFLYSGTQPFRLVDYVVVPSEFSRRYYWDKLGLACQRLPNVVDRGRVEAQGRSPQQLSRRRPDIPILVVEGRGRAADLRETGVDVDAMASLRIMANTGDPREFYGITKLLLVPSLWNEAWPLVPAEGMINGIPVLGSNRGGLPEPVGDAGFLFDIPARYTPESRDLPSEQEIEPWIETIVRLWDDPRLYEQYSQAARQRAESWRPERLESVYRDFFGNVFPQPGPPLLPTAFI
jgi:GT2 family glycosyltransferase